MFDFDDIAGPYLTADLFLQLKADTAKDPWWRLSGGLQAGGGLRFKVWKFDFDKGIPDIWSEDWTIAKADKPPVPAFTTKTLPDADDRQDLQLEGRRDHVARTGHVRRQRGAPARRGQARCLHRCYHRHREGLRHA